MSDINKLLHAHDFEDWRTATVLVEVKPNAYTSGKIHEVSQIGCLLVQPNISSYDEMIEVNVYENLFGILSDNAPAIQDLIEGKFVICKHPINQQIYQTALILEKTKEGKFKVLFQDRNEAFYVPRQSIRLFLPPWHDGLFLFIFKLTNFYITRSCKFYFRN